MMRSISIHYIIWRLRSKLGGDALADTIMDRIISKSQTIKIFGDKSMRSR